MYKLLSIRRSKKGVLTDIAKGTFKQCNLIEMLKGSVWGNHYHKETKELFFVYKGELLVNQKPLKKQSKRAYTKTYKEGDIFVIKPYTLHTVTALKKTICIVLYSVPFNKRKPDLYRSKKMPKL